MALLQIPADLRHHPALGAGGGERQGAEQLPDQLGCGFEGAGQLVLSLGAYLQDREVVGQQLFQYQPLLCRVLAALEQGQRHRGRRAVQQLQGRGQIDLLGIEAGRQQLLDPVEVELGQGLIREAAQGELAQPLCGGVDGGEGLFGLAGLLLAEQLVLGVGHLQAVLAGTCLAEAADKAALGQAVFLGSGEIEEAQGQAAGAVADTAHQHAAAPHHQLGVLDLALDGTVQAGRQIADGPHLGAVLVAQGEVEQQVLYRGQPQPLEFLQHLAADTLEAVEGDFIQFHQLDARKHCKYVQMIGVVAASMQAALCRSGLVGKGAGGGSSMKKACRKRQAFSLTGRPGGQMMRLSRR